MQSILNNHIDEILYFFEATKYNIVIIEDIERFEQTEVFTKLREINLLINNSKKINKDVVFIYAIGDDMFQDYDRTKFFDFMIPIIPVINYSNSNEQLLKIIQNNNYGITDELIESISLFIDDMRLLYNIMNEYHVYSKNLNADLDQNKLLSMMVYKNIFPSDFIKLSNNQGVLYEVLSNKRNYIQIEINKTENEIAQLVEEITKLETIRIKDVKQLRTLYIAEIVEKINSSNQPFKSFWINNKEYRILQATEDDIFQLFKESSSTQYILGSNNQRQIINYSFTDVENNIEATLSYDEREQLIVDLNNNKIELNKKKIEELEGKNSLTRKLKIKDLISNEKINIQGDTEKQDYATFFL